MNDDLPKRREIPVLSLMLNSKNISKNIHNAGVFADYL